MKYFILLLISILINFISWNYFGILFIVNLFILFYISNQFQNLSFAKKTIILLSFYLCLNISATFWLLEVDVSDAILTYIANSFLFLLFSAPLFLKNIKFRHFFFIIFWICGEILLTKWDLAWPWLNFGNVLGNQWYLIQWYSYCGIYGGSLWILLTALNIFHISEQKKMDKWIFTFLLLILFPIISLYNYTFNKETTNTCKIEKFTCYIPQKKYSNYSRTKKLHNYILKNNINHTIITTELFYSNVYSDYLKSSDISFFYNDLFKRNDSLKFIIGSEIINNDSIKFNGITCFNKNYTLFRTKKRYVPGTEFVTPILRPLFGKSFYTKNYSDDTSKILNSIKTIPFVCYESIFSDFIASFLSDKIIVLTSEAFLGDNKFGKNQYLNIERIRAIENNRYLLKSSYNGYSCVINPKGKIIKKLNPNFNSVSLPLIQSKSFYQKFIQSL